MPGSDSACPANGPMRSAPRRQRCPHCRGKVQPVITGGVGVVFKGDGFYVTDSRRRTQKKSDSAAAEPGQPAAETPPSAGKAGAAKSEATPD